MTDQISACPECDATNIHSTNDNPGGPDPRADWGCPRCGVAFDEPVWRERHRMRPERTNSEHANALLDTDPEEVGG